MNTADDSLQNIELGSASSASSALADGKVFQGGNWNHLHRMLDLKTGSALMYVGDHMYSGTRTRHLHPVTRTLPSPSP